MVARHDKQKSSVNYLNEDFGLFFSLKQANKLLTTYKNYSFSSFCFNGVPLIFVTELL